MEKYRMTIDELDISAPAYRILKISLPLVAAFLCYIAFYTMTDRAVYETAVAMTERALGGLLLSVVAAFAVDIFGKHKD